MTQAYVEPGNLGPNDLTRALAPLLVEAATRAKP